MSERLVIGAGDECDLRVNDPYASPRHAAVSRHPDGTMWIEDLGSTNGTHIRRGRYRIRVHGPIQMRPGDTVIIGRTPIPWEGK